MIIKVILSIVVMTFFSIYVYSQKNDNTAENLSDKFHWGVSIAPSMIAKGHIHGDKYKYRLSSSPNLGGEVLINYYYNFASNYSLVFSAGGEVLVHNLYYEIPEEMFDPPTASNISSGPLRMPITFVKSQAELQFKFLKNQKKSWFGAAGISILYSIQGPDEYSAAILLGTSSNFSKEFLHIGEFNKDKPKAWLNFHVSVGHEWVINSGNRLQANLKFNYSSANFSAEPYRFTVGNQPEVSGKYGIPGSYLGLCMSYIFARSKKA